MHGKPEPLFCERFCSSVFLCPCTFASIAKGSIPEKAIMWDTFKQAMSTIISIKNLNGVSQKRLCFGILSHFWPLCWILLRGEYFTKRCYVRYF